MAERDDIEPLCSALKRWFDRAPVSSFIGQQLVDCGPGAAEVQLPFNPNFDQGMGITHGGLVTTIADTAGFVAANTVVEGGVAATVELKINLLASVRKETIVARGEVVQAGRSIVVCDLRVRDETGRLVAVGLGTYRVVGDEALRRHLLGQ